MIQRSQVELAAHVVGSFDVFVNGVPQERGVNYEQQGRLLVFRSELAQEGNAVYALTASCADISPYAAAHVSTSITP